MTQITPPKLASAQPLAMAPASALPLAMTVPTWMKSFSVAPTTTPTAQAKSRMTLYRSSAGDLPFPTCLAIAPKTLNPFILQAPSFTQYKLSSPTHLFLPALPPPPLSPHFHPTSMFLPPSPFNPLPSTLSPACGQIVVPSSTAYQISSSTLPLQSQDDSHLFSQSPLSCHWGDCAMFPSPSSIPSSSSASSDDDVLNILTTHLMQDHLGLNYPIPPSTILQPPLPDPQDTSGTVHQPLSPNPPSHDCSGTHICKWNACTQSFPSCGDLTAHITSVHIGGGKAHYECFWEGCNRHGTNGFSSKQKISRHLQVRLSPYFIKFRSLQFQSHTGHRPFQCQVCNQNFSEAATLQQHKRRHTQERPYVCDFPGCGKAFAITGALTIHKRTHNGLRPFKFFSPDNLSTEPSQSLPIYPNIFGRIPTRSAG
ncbi:hypothetical protein J3R83DRAFT_8352 [Lanmaoa asiatica]|nr:hypothetical protein J3R83DRAFT_8352 [Lanmaoa asiatica]